ncbi:MAG TPA: toll/interleukin-1 receptor domain-containing protein, partial [Planctomycetaceae bacterium]|nr:toll/interleukin-1 receptor domain-containing protein [Planctomycetaceae bacterium]
MANAFVSFAGEDGEFVQRMVQQVEQHRHRLWHFTRDSRPAEVYLDEIVSATDGCDIFILVASIASLDSFQIDKEVQLAHEKNKVILMIQIDVTTDDIQATHPGWLLPLGARSYLRLDGQPEQKLFDEVARTLESHSHAPAQKPARWAADATLIHLHNLSRVLFQTSAVKEFLEGDHQFFVSANKGVGKTLLLKSKRARLMEEHTQRSGTRSNVLFLPQDKPFLDNLAGEWPTLAKDKQQLLADLRTSRRLWRMALRLAILSHFPDIFAQLRPDDLQIQLRHSLQQCVPPRSAATIVFRTLLTTQTTKAIHVFLDRLDAPVERAFRSIHSGVFCFIDTIEQGVSNLTRSAWINLQAGLIEAAWDVMTSNNHIKVFASIREEAFANYTSNSKVNLYSAVLGLRYTLEELRKILDSLTQLYEHESSFHQFAGRAKVQNLHCNVEEDS